MRLIKVTQILSVTMLLVAGSALRREAAARPLDGCPDLSYSCDPDEWACGHPAAACQSALADACDNADDVNWCLGHCVSDPNYDSCEYDGDCDVLTLYCEVHFEA
jgi:hypothetical protein